MRVQRCASIREFPAARGRSPHNKEKNRTELGEQRDVGVDGERDTVLILLDAEEADSINSHGRERNDVVRGGASG